MNQYSILLVECFIVVSVFWFLEKQMFCWLIDEGVAVVEVALVGIEVVTELVVLVELVF